MGSMNSNDTMAKAIAENWDLYKALSLETKKPGVDSLLESLETPAEAIIAPASTKLEFVGCYPGGLVEHSLRVCGLALKLRETYGFEESITTESVMAVCLFHDIGKVGTNKQEYYTTQHSDWHRTKLGQLYEVNPALAHFPVSQLSLWRLAFHGVSLTTNEWYAVSSLRPEFRDESPATPTTGEPMLSVLLKQAVKVSCMMGKGKRNVTKIELDFLKG